MTKDEAIIGVSDHGGWAILVTVARDGRLLDRHRVTRAARIRAEINHVVTRSTEIYGRRRRGR